jgi:hypothetical protein
MGCDIHVYVEVKVKGKWVLINAPYIRRNYDLFAKMANVRNYENIKPISEPKGLPENISDGTKLYLDIWEDDAHSASWLSPKEMGGLQDWLDEMEPKTDYSINHTRNHYEKEFGYLFGNSIDGFIKYPQDQPEWLQDVRVIFWFDN